MAYFFTDETASQWNAALAGCSCPTFEPVHLPASAPALTEPVLFALLRRPDSYYAADGDPDVRTYLRWRSFDLERYA